MKLLIVILNYHVTELTVECLRSLAPEVSRMGGVRAAVCENGSGVDAEHRLRAAIEDNGWTSWCELTAIHPNRGFTGGNNFIIRKALASPTPPEYFLLLNADTLVKNDAIGALMRFMDNHPRVGIAGSRLDFEDGSPNGSPFRFPGVANEFDIAMQLGLFSRLLARHLVRMPTPASACKVDWVSGASMIIRRTLIEQIGLLDEGLYTYFDDVDYCLNAKRAGWETWYVPASHVMHLEGASTGINARNLKRRPEYWFQARRRFFLKNYGPVRTALADAAFILGFSLWRIRRRIQRKPETDPPYMLTDFVRNSVFFTGFELRKVRNPALGDSE